MTNLVKSSIDADYQKIESNVQAFNESQDNPFGIPAGFHYARNSKGENIGFGFYCTRCKLHVPHYAPDSVKHCGTVSNRPTGLFARLRMKTFTFKVF